MEFNKTMYQNFPEECVNKFGKVIGDTIVRNAEERLTKMISEIDDRNSKRIRWHLEKCLLPTIAMYLSLKNNKDANYEAYNTTLDICQKIAIKQKEKLEILGCIPF